MNAPEMPIGSTTTTEELIVQYLDGELLRSELEIMLFDRLAKSEEARQILREHLVIRGAIHSSLEDNRFQLSADLDDRTRTRIEEVLKALPVQKGAGQPDAAPARIDPAKRRLERWSVRPAYAALLLLFAVTATWFATRSTETSAPEVAMTATEPANTPTQSLTAPTTSTEAPKVIVKEKIVEKPVIRYVSLPVKNQSADIAQNTQQSAAQQAPESKDQTEASPSDVMISRRFGKLLNETAKKEVIVTTHDRL
jgi:hypothetical protein